MSRRPANITQADIAHAIRAADQATTNRHVSEVSRLIEMAYCRLSPDLMMESSAPLDKRTGSGIALDIKDAAGMRWRYERPS
jgi:hypothetical protein